jgi:hypothetical protein
VNIAFHPAPSSHPGTRPLPAPRIPPRPRTLCALCVSAFSSHDLCPLNFKLLALSVVEGSTACPVYPEERREDSRRVNRLSLRLTPAVDFKLSAVSCRPFFPNSHRITSFAHPHTLTPIESHLCKKQGGGVPLTPNRGRLASCLCATRRNPRNSIPFMRLLHNSRTPRGGELRQKKKEGTMNRAATREVVSFMWKSYPKWKARPAGIHQRT